MTIYFDLETFPIEVGQPAPQPVCGSFAQDDHETVLCGAHELAFCLWVEEILDSDELVIGANTAYDFSCLLAWDPSLSTKIFEKYEKLQVGDVQLMQGVMDLSYDGRLAKKYPLSDLGTSYGWRDRSEEKHGDDIWRLRYNELAGIDAKDYPEAAAQYAIEDTDETRFVWKKQRIAKSMKNLSEEGHLYQARAAWGLRLMSCQGFWVDHEQRLRAKASVEEAMKPEAIEPLFEAGLIRPYEPSRQFSNGCGKWTKPKPESENQGAVRNHIEKVCALHGIKPKKTDTGATSRDQDMLNTLEGLDPLLDIYAERKGVEKLASTYLPNLASGIVYTDFNTLVSTGRSSSRKSGLLPSMNMQNQPRISGERSIRECLVPRPGYYFCSVDYSSLELCTLAWTCHKLFGKSVLYDFINEYGASAAHEFLGAQICYRWEPAFRKGCDEQGLTSKTEIFLAFKELKKVDKEIWKHYRTFAKPTGLGFPGGLGAETFVTYARTSYGVKVTLREAEQLRDMWFNTYPEMREYFKYIKNKCKDVRAKTRGKFVYECPDGMVRRGCTFTAAANGFALQSPAAYGAKDAVFHSVRAMFDPSLESPLLGCRPMVFVHDEVIAEVRIETAHEEAMELSRIMATVMQGHFPGINIEAEPALMERWYKDAEPVFEEGRLVPWCT